MSPKPFNCAVIGYGMSAKVFHVPLIQALPNDFNLYAVVQRTPKPQDDVTKDHPDVKHFNSVDQVYADRDVDIVVVTTTPGSHFEICRKALEAGKHVIVEKPFVPSVAEALELIEISKKSGKLLTVYQNRRWDLDFLTLQSVLGSLGDIAEFETHYDRHRPDPPPQTWKAEDAPGHGSIYDLGTHLIDQVYHLFGKPRRVTAFIGNQRRGVTGGAADSFTALLHYQGMLVTCKAGIISADKQQLRYWIRGTKGTFKKYGLDSQETQLKEGLRPGAKGFGEDPEENFAVVTTNGADGNPVEKVHPSVTPATYVEYYRIFAKALKGEGEVPVSAQDASEVLEIIEAAKKSSEEGKTIDL